MSPASKSIPPLRHLAPAAQDLVDLLQGERGLHLLVGPLASGKTTFMTALLEDGLRRHDFLVTLFARTQRYQFGDDAGFLIRSALNRFHLGGEGLLQGAIDKGSDVIAVDEIDDVAMLRDAAIVASRAGQVLAAMEAESPTALTERIQEMARQPGGEKLRDRLATCLESVTYVDLGKTEETGERLRHVRLTRADRASIAGGDLTVITGLARV